MIINLIAIVFVGAGLYVGYWQAGLLRDKIIVVGRVTALPAGRGSKGGTVYGVLAEFKTTKDQVHHYRSSWSSSNPGYAVGDPIRLYYAAESPEKCGICSFGARFGVAYILVLLGLGLLVGKYGLVLGQHLMDQFYPVTLETSFPTIHAL
jgi:hypothetical protein